MQLEWPSGALPLRRGLRRPGPAAEPDDSTIANGPLRRLYSPRNKGGSTTMPEGHDWTQAALSLVTLSLMEIVLGIDNIVFISILVGKLPKEQQRKGRNLGLSLALLIRLGLLGAIKWIMGLTAVLFTIGSWQFTGQKLILLGGGLFL